MLRDSVTTLLDDDYPPLLREIADPPLALHFRGDRSLLQRPAVAVVGSRRASPYAINAARRITEPLAAAGVAIVSGLALGVDAAAHEAALEANGATIAVLGTGIDVTYPRGNRRLYKRVGLLLTELPPGTPPMAMNFPIRNRIIAGLTLGTIVIEATARSGSLITARLAAEQNREVFAVPGSIFSEGTEGTHRLIQYGAKLVHQAQDVLDELRLEVTLPVAPGEEAPHADVLAALSHDEPLAAERAAAKLGRAPESLAEALLELELGGWVRSLPGGRYVRTAK
ncbi:MAG TPA: DNA-processing protein DprA [Thermoanaerobaculia bacterium]|nr:DNA-processing protein DprA [Thermoanaerobaculia bacterium]